MTKNAGQVYGTFISRFRKIGEGVGSAGSSEKGRGDDEPVTTAFIFMQVGAKTMTACTCGWALDVSTWQLLPFSGQSGVFYRQARDFYRQLRTF